MHSNIVFESRLGPLPREDRYTLAALSPVEDDRWNKRLDHAAFHVVAKDGDRIVGFSYAYLPWGSVGESWEKFVPNAIELGGLIVDPEYRRQGIMSELVRLRLNLVQVTKKTPVCVTLSDNYSVIGYYETRGWTPRRPFERDGVSLTPWVLEAIAQAEEAV